MKTYNGLKAKPCKSRFLCYSTIFFACNVNGQFYTCENLSTWNRSTKPIIASSWLNCMKLEI